MNKRVAPSLILAFGLGLLAAGCGGGLGYGTIPNCNADTPDMTGVAADYPMTILMRVSMTVTDSETQIDYPLSKETVRIVTGGLANPTASQGGQPPLPGGVDIEAKTDKDGILIYELTASPPSDPETYEGRVTYVHKGVSSSNGCDTAFSVTVEEPTP